MESEGTEGTRAEQPDGSASDQGIVFLLLFLLIVLLFLLLSLLLLLTNCYYKSSFGSSTQFQPFCALGLGTLRGDSETVSSAQELEEASLSVESA